MSDLIKREDAIKTLRLEYPVMPLFKSLREEWAIKTEGFRKAEEVIMSIPSADRPQGHYIKGENGERYCSNCKRIDDKYSVARFCWWCGAKMKGADDDN